ncbi:hypothetical protein MMC30_004830 [Trapelia coarctata]|nr:hypothetical protein [Trapelia coarctata]
MSLNIQVSHLRKTKVFHGGDTISGIVVATGPIKQASTIVEIKFKGTSQTLIKQQNGHNKTVYRDKAKFFRLTTVLHRGACNLEKDASESWPFTFQLPLLTEPKEGRNLGIIYSKTAGSPYAKAAHPLPPNIALSGTKHGKEYKAFISYEIRAELHRSEVFSRNLHKAGSLPVAQRRARDEDGESPDPQMTTTTSQYFMHATSRLLPDHASKLRSLREWASDVFTSKAPSIFFTLSARSPKTLIERQAIPIELRLAVNTARSTVQQWPEITLLAASYKLKAHTHIRARGFWDKDVDTKPSAVVMERRLVVETPENTAPLKLKDCEVVDIGTLYNLTLPKGGVMPSFDSYAVSRRYAAHLTVKILCAGKKFEREFIWTPVVLLPVVLEGDESGDEGDIGALGKAEGIGVLEFSEAMEIGVGILEVVGNVLDVVN